MKALKTPVCDLLGIELPVISAPISASPNFVAAVCNAGCLGTLQATWFTDDELRQAIREIKSQTEHPFAVNFVLSLTEASAHSHIDTALDEGAPIVSTFWGDPATVISRIHDAGALSLHTVGSADEARKVVDFGVDVVVAQGVEAGGHVWGEVGGMVLTPAVVDAVPYTPVVAAGGIADGRGMAAAFALGASAVWVGTRFLLADECNIHHKYRERIASAKETDTVLSRLYDGGWEDAPNRCLKNETIAAWIAAGCPSTGSRPNEGETLAYDSRGNPIPRYDLQEPLEGFKGDVASMALYAGQSAGLSNETAPVSEIITTMVEQAASILCR